MDNRTPTRRFAPLKARALQNGNDEEMSLVGIIFDMDGTLCEPQNWMFGKMREVLGITKSEDIIDHVYSLPESEQQDAHDQVQAIEREAMAKQVPQAGLVTLMEYLDSKKIKKGICTRNFDAPVTHLLSKHLPGHVDAFAPIITREFRPPKPSPGGILHIAKAWGVVDESHIKDHKPVSKVPLPLIMVGDSIDDIVAGHDAGAATVLLRSEGKEDLEKDPRTDLVIDRLDELIEILENGFEGQKSET